MIRKTIFIFFILALITACAKKQTVVTDDAKMQKAKEQKNEVYDTFQKDKNLEKK